MDFLRSLTYDICYDIHNSKTDFGYILYVGKKRNYWFTWGFHGPFLITLRLAQGNSGVGFMAVWESVSVVLRKLHIRRTAQSIDENSCSWRVINLTLWDLNQAITSDPRRWNADRRGAQCVARTITELLTAHAEKCSQLAHKSLMHSWAAPLTDNIQGPIETCLQPGKELLSQGYELAF